jgi:hypothetical protein
MSAITPTQTIYITSPITGSGKTFSRSLRNINNIVKVNEIVELKNKTDNTSTLVKVLTQNSDWLVTFEKLNY